MNVDSRCVVLQGFLKLTQLVVHSPKVLEQCGFQLLVLTGAF